MHRPERLPIAIEPSVLEDLDRRLAAWRPAPSLAGDGWRYGVDGAWLASLVEHWRTRYDWRAQEAAMNRYAHHRVVLHGQTIHWMHAPSAVPGAIPLLLTHGWPWTFWDFAKVIEPLRDPLAHGGELADAFDVHVVSLPGFGFSSPLSRPGLTYVDTADLWVELMCGVLGHERFAAHGGDWGALVTSQLGHRHADRMIGIHVSGGGGLGLFNVDRPWADLLSQLYVHAPPERRAELVEWESRRAAHVAVHTLDPQTLAHALHDSPVGMAAWLLERRWAWSDCHGDIESVFTKDELITTAMIYWVTETLWSSVRYYAEAARNPWVPSHGRTPRIEAPTGLSVFLPDRPPGVPTEGLRRAPHVTFFREHSVGGHFAAAERPIEIVEDLRATFRTLR